MPNIIVELPALGEDPWGEKLLAAVAAVLSGLNSSLSGAGTPRPLSSAASAGDPTGPGAAADHVHPTTGLATVGMLNEALVAAGGTPPTRAVATGTGLTGGGDLTTDRTLSVVFGTAAGTAAEGDDARIEGAVQAVSTLGAATTDLVRAKIAGEPVARVMVRADGTIGMGSPPVAVSGVAGTSTVTVTTAADHNLGTGDKVTISGVGGYAGANGTFTVTRTSATQFTLDSTTGSGTYTTGGTVQRILGGTGAATEGTWNLAPPDARDGLVVRCRRASSGNPLLIRDPDGAPIFNVGAFGGAGVISGDPHDLLYTASNVFGRSFAANSSGGVRIAAGDPAGGVDIVAIGNAATPPSANPDGSHQGEGAFTTAAGVALWARDGRLLLRSSAGHTGEILPGVGVGRRLQSVSAPGGDTTLLLEGVLPPAVATTGVTATADDQAAGPLVKYLTAASSGVDAGVISAFGVVQPQWLPYLYARLMTDPSAVTSTRLAVGMATAEVAADAGPASTGAYTAAAGAWLRYDTAVDTTAFWRAVTASGTTATVTTTTAGIAADTSYELAVEVNAAGTAIRFWVNGVLVATHTANLPGASAALAYLARLRTLAASARALRLGRVAVNQK